MVFSMYQGVRIAAIAASVAERVVDINALKDRPDEDPKVIDTFIKKTGITQIHKCDVTQTAADFSYTAAKAIEAAGKYSPEEIGVLIDLTQTPDYRTPSTACALHKRLGLSKSCLAFDINLGCSGFVYGVALAAGILSTSTASKALVLVGDTLARGRNPENKAKRKSNTSLLFGDASAAVLLVKDDTASLRAALMSDGTGHKALSTPYNAWKHPVGPEGYPGDDLAVFNFTINEIPEIILAFLERTGTAITDYDELVLHQANMMIMKNIAKRVSMPMEKVPVSLDRYGNTSGASIPLTLVDRYGESREPRVLKLLTSGFGVGLSWGVVSFEIDVRDILPLTIGKDTYDDGYPENPQP